MLLSPRALLGLVLRQLVPPSLTDGKRRHPQFCTTVEEMLFSAYIGGTAYTRVLGTCPRSAAPPAPSFNNAAVGRLAQFGGVRNSVGERERERIFTGHKCGSLIFCSIVCHSVGQTALLRSSVRHTASPSSQAGDQIVPSFFCLSLFLPSFLYDIQSHFVVR